MWIIAGAIEQIDAQPVGLLLGLADQPGAAPELAEHAAADAPGIETGAVTEDIVRQLVRDDRRDLVFTTGEIDQAGVDLDIGGLIRGEWAGFDQFASEPYILPQIAWLTLDILRRR
jgi:hypothetical protein